jgi:dienelactone hydrolase
VLLPDKRGSEKSEGDWRTSPFEDLAGDTLSAIEFVQNQEQFDVSYAGVIGMSQGGWIAPLVATKSEDVAFVVSMSGAAVTTDEQLLYEEVNHIVEMGTYRVVAKMIAPITTNMIKQREFWSYIAEFDPIPYWEQVHAPSFVAFGENDPNVPVEESIKRLQNLDNGMHIKVDPEGGHGIVDPETHKVQNDFLSDLTKFIVNAG